MRREKQIRTNPNILITGTPGTGKTTLCSQLMKNYGKYFFHNHNISDLSIEKGFISGEDKERKCKIIDEDKVCDYLEAQGMDEEDDKGGHIVDYHSCDFFAERYFDLVFVIRSDNKVLGERYLKRGYGEESSGCSGGQEMAGREKSHQDHRRTGQIGQHRRPLIGRFPHGIDLNTR